MNYTVPPTAQSITDSAREGSHQVVQDMGKAGCHKQGKQEVGARDSRKSSRKQPVMSLDGVGVGVAGSGEMGDGEWFWRCMVGQGKSKPMRISQPLEGRTDKSYRPGTRRDKHPRQHTAESRGKAQISNLDMRGWATTITITANRAGAESTGTKWEKGTGIGSYNTRHNTHTEQM